MDSQFSSTSISNNWLFLLRSTDEQELTVYPLFFHLESTFNVILNSLSSISHRISKVKLRQLIIKDLKSSLSRIMLRSMALEFSTLVRKSNDNLTYSEFIASFQENGQLLVFFKKYPVMEKVLLSIITNYQNSTIELIDRISNDVDDIKDIFSTCNPTLIDFKQLGDPHDEGRRTTLLLFNNNHYIEQGETFKIVYKPRSVSVDNKFQFFIKYISDNFNIIPLKCFKILDKGKYGWIEYIEHLPLEKYGENSFYYRIGFYLGIFYSLNGKDLHYENLIAHGNFPVFIDLECLLSTPVNDLQNDDLYWPNVHDTAIIPPLKKKGALHFDASSILNNDKQSFPYSLFRMTFQEKNGVCIERYAPKIKPKKNNPFFKDNKKSILSPKFYKDAIIQGFKDYYELVVANKNKFISIVKVCFSDCSVRMIFRATYIYDKLMLESYHPKLLSNAEKYYEFISQIKIMQSNDLYNNVSLLEIDNIIRGDIPYFFSHSDERAVKTSNGEKFPYLYPDGPLERATKKIYFMNKNDLIKQTYFISQSIDENYANIKTR